MITKNSSDTITSLLLTTVFLFLVITVHLLGLDPQKNINQYVLDTYTTEDGLPQMSVLSISQTQNGYLWLGTYDGLARFDGVRFVVFDKSNTPEMGNNSVNVLLKDSTDRLWIGTPNGLLCYRSGIFRNYSVPDGLAGNFIIATYEDRLGKIWVGTAKGLNVYNEKTDHFTTYTTADGLNNNYITAITGDETGRLWVGTNSGLNCLDKNRIINYSDMPGLSAADIRALCSDDKGTLWIGSSNNGLAALRNGVLQKYSQKEGIPVADIRTIYLDRSGILWIGSHKSGVFRFANGTFTPLPLKYSLLNSAIRCFYEDREGSLWIGAKNGLCRLKDEKFIFYNSHNGLPADMIRSVFHDSKGNTWIGSVDAGVTRYNNTHFKTFGLKEGLKNTGIWSIAEGNDGSIWLGTYGGGLHRIKEDTITVISTAEGLTNTTVRAVFVDRQHNIWAGTNGGGVNVFSETGRKIANYTTENGVTDNFIYAITQDPQGVIWIGTYNGGLNRFKDGLFTAYGPAEGLAESSIWALYADAEGTLWIGTNDAGLHRLKDGKISRFTVKDGLYSGCAFVVLEDGHGTLWMNCNKGIYNVKKRELADFAAGKIDQISCTSFDRDGGIQFTESSGPAQPAASKTADDTLWFATGGGIIVMEPGKTVTNRVVPPVVVERVVIDNQCLSPTTPAVMPPGRGNLEISYTALSLMRPRKVLFKYKLEGFDDNWTAAGTRRTAYYTNIPPGNYRFRVIACNNDGVWNTEGAVFPFRLKPHFYQQTAFFVIIGLCFLVVIFSLYRIRIHRLKVKEKLLIEIIDQRTVELRGKNDQLQMEIVQRTRAEADNVHLIAELRDAIANIKTLKGLIPICSGCKKVRADDGYWQQVDVYIRDRSEVDFSHSLCPECARRLYPNLPDSIINGMD